MDANNDLLVQGGLEDDLEHNIKTIKLFIEYLVDIINKNSNNTLLINKIAEKISKIKLELSNLDLSIFKNNSNFLENEIITVSPINILDFIGDRKFSFSNVSDDDHHIINQNSDTESDDEDEKPSKINISTKTLEEQFLSNSIEIDKYYYVKLKV
jgi:hypothetical protein